MTPILDHIQLGMTREQVIEAIGEPDVIGRASRKYKIPTVYRYGHIELWFDRHKDGGLLCVWDDKEEKILAGG